MSCGKVYYSFVLEVDNNPTENNSKESSVIILLIFDMHICDAGKIMDYRVSGLLQSNHLSPKDSFKGNDSLISWMLPPLGYFLCVKNDNKITS